MRYVVGVCLLTGFIIWDGFRNDGRYLEIAVERVRSVLNEVGFDA